MSAPSVTETLRDCLRRHGLLHSGAVLLAAVSGGSDSMALLYGLTLLRGEAGFQLHACHVQHGLRGEDSLADEQLVRDCCTRWEIPLTVHTAQLGGDIHQPGIETRARDCRRAFFAEMVRRISADALLLAHHQDDQAETLLLHLLRGAGGKGLAGMSEGSPFSGSLMLRPFLNIPKAHLLAALAHWGVPHREDGSNREALTLRNALRLEVLPLLEQLSPGCTGRMAQTARLLRRDEAALDGQAKQLLRRDTLLLPGLHAIRMEGLRSAEEAVAIRSLRLWYNEGLRRAGLTPDEQQLSYADSECLLTFALQGNPTASGSAEATSPATLNLPNDLQAFRGSCWLHLQRQDGSPVLDAPPEMPITDLLPMAASVPGGEAAAPGQQGEAVLSGWDGENAHSLLTLTLRTEVPQQAPNSAQTAFLPLSLLPGAVLRRPMPGDTIHPLGAPGSKPLRRYLTDRRIDPPFRARLPVLARGDTILWIPGLCTARQLAFTPGQPCLRIQLTCQPPYLPQNIRKGD